MIVSIMGVLLVRVSDMYHWHRYSSPEVVAEAAADTIVKIAQQSIAESGCFRIVLAGGSTPAICYRLLVKAVTDWSAWRIYYGDERCLPPDHADRNSVMAWDALLQHVSVPKHNIFPIPTETGAELAAASYRQVIDAARAFDLVLLGMGEDGHTASLFPGREIIEDASVIAVHDAPKPPSERVSLNYSALRNTRHLMLLVTGGSKRAAVAEWQSGENTDLPVARLLDKLDFIADVFIDKAAEN
ncbi:MAG: 6-phosphogluconolactonase [Gammaproteobacteria bacterium]